MRISTFVHLILLFQLMLIVSIVYTENHHINNSEINGDLENMYRKTILSLLQPSWMINELIRNKRNERLVEEIPTRHAKHRKRRRYRNRSTCVESTSGSKLSLQQDNNTMPLDIHISKETKKNRDENNTVLEIEEELDDISIGVNDRVQEMYNKTKEEDYNVTDTDMEGNRIKSKKGSFVVIERNSSTGKLSDEGLIGSYDEPSITDEIQYENVDRSSKKRERSKKDEFTESTDYSDEIYSPAIYSATDDHVIIHESLSDLLAKLFQSLRNATTTDERNIFKELNFVNGTNEDPCQKWLNSRDKLEQVFLDGLTSLPACPCQYPSNIFYDDKIWDEKRMKYFRWRDVSGGSQRLDVYKPGATYCIRSLLTQGSGSAAVQHCCYDRQRKLLTRGSGAGTPNFVSPEISPILHERIDILPWRLCKGDFSRYNGVRPPNNDNACQANPDDEEYQRQIDNTKYY
ncbi:uncharacterized protein LOC100871288 isoform X1 [Apis florea]|uniref:uncharacterized protein LOC100871288 isoform X1 n=2 Tax=Apis florea TaxID=7463 RepID=UPI000252A9E2|nr:uncharacterized protein LOC100871288 isoform X1 [Apis florea]